MSEAFRELRTWVSYLRDIGVRDLAVPSDMDSEQNKPREASRRARTSPQSHTDDNATTAVPAKTPEATPASPKSPQPAAQPSLMSIEERGFSGDPPADRAARLVEIRDELGDCTRCKLHGGRKNIVFGVGNPEARLMFVGEGPGEQEDRQGEPFVGRAGQKLDEMIAAIGLQRADVYIANIVKCRPPKNRDPESDEITTCSPFLEAQIEAIRPRVIVTLGGPSTKTLLGTRTGITRLRGQWHSFRGIDVMPTFHPAYVLRNYTLETRRKVWEDLKAAKARAEGD